jgi:hypothetical protein
LPPTYRWTLTLLEAGLEEEAAPGAAAGPGDGAPASPAAKRTVSRSVSLAARAGPPAAAAAVGAPLPAPLRALVTANPALLPEDAARRFLVGLGSEPKACLAAAAMLDWTLNSGLAGVASQPQPAFAAMKRHYPHGLLGWSRRRDCLVELECMGRWPAAHAALRAEGVDDAAMLRHLYFTYVYAFSRVDARPLPAGKTVKIVDLEGLAMADLSSPAFKLIARAGSVLAVNFPQRLHKCFLVNAPGWWALAWRAVAPIIPARVRANIQLFGRGDGAAAARAIAEWADAEVVPARYGGASGRPLGECPLEVELAAYVAALAARR